VTLAKFLETVRARHNADGDSYWGTDELYGLVTNRCNEVLSVIGLLEATDTDTSVATTQAYDYPSGTVTVRQVNYKANRLKRISFRQWQHFKTDTTTTSGLPTMWVPWNRQILMVPIPDTSGDTITIYNYQEHPEINGGSQATIDIPSVLHNHLVNGVLADMFAKDENPVLSRQYEEKWLGIGYAACQKFKATEDSASSFQTIGDCDTEDQTSIGIV